jgi:hypothetical protein
MSNWSTRFVYKHDKDQSYNVLYEAIRKICVYIICYVLYSISTSVPVCENTHNMLHRI